MWDFNGENDATRHGCKGPGSAEDLVEILSGLYKGEKEDFLQTSPLNGFSMNNPRRWVSGHFIYPAHAFEVKYLTLRFRRRSCVGMWRAYIVRLHNPRIQEDPLIRLPKRIRT